MTSFSRQKPLKSKIQKHTIVGKTKFYYRVSVSAQTVKNWKTSLKEITFWWQLTRREKKTKSFKKVKLVYRKSLQSIILLDFWERTEQTKIVVFIKLGSSYSFFFHFP